MALAPSLQRHTAEDFGIGPRPRSAGPFVLQRPQHPAAWKAASRFRSLARMTVRPSRLPTEHAQTPAPPEPPCVVCNQPIRPGDNRVTVQNQHYHARCYERRESRRSRPRVW